MTDTPHDLFGAPPSDVDRVRLENLTEECILNDAHRPARAALQDIVALEGVDSEPYESAIEQIAAWMREQILSSRGAH